MGFLYVNRKDPLLVVPKLNGTGWTLNFGHKSLLWYLFLAVVVLLLYVGVRYFFAV